MFISSADDDGTGTRMTIIDDIRDKCERLDIPIMGIAPVGRWADPPFEPWPTERYWPQSILPGARSVVVIGYPIDVPIMDTAPSEYYMEAYRTINSLLDHATYRISRVINACGERAIYIPRDGYGSLEALGHNPAAFFSHRHAALLAGLGTFGVNDMILTREYGPRVRFGSIITTADLPASDMIEEDLCTHCGRCVRMCPVSAIDSRDYPIGRTDKEACRQRSLLLRAQHRSPCGICIKVCPVGEDRAHFGREDMGAYRGKDPDLQRTWDHIRAHGSLPE